MENQQNPGQAPNNTANSTSQGYQAPQGYEPQGYAPQNAPQGYAPQPQGYQPQGYPPQGQLQGPQPQGYPPQGYQPQGQPQGYQPQVYYLAPQNQPLLPNQNRPRSSTCNCTAITWFYLLAIILEVVGIVLLIVSWSTCPSGCSNTECFGYNYKIKNYAYYSCTCDDGFCRNYGNIGMIVVGGILLGLGILSMISVTVYRRCIRRNQ